MTLHPRGILLDIFEDRDPDADPDPFRIVSPTNVVLNGEEVLVMKGDDITIRAEGGGLVMATMTLPVGRLRINPTTRTPDTETTPEYDACLDALCAHGLLEAPTPNTIDGAFSFAAAAQMTAIHRPNRTAGDYLGRR